MRLHIITVGQPKLDYAVRGWQEYFKRLQRYHDIRTTHIADKKAYDADYIQATAGKSFKICLEIEGKILTSQQLADLLDTHTGGGRELSFIIGGPDGLPNEVRASADYQLSLSRLTLPHDLAMVVLLETLYRSSTINAGQPYHR